MKFQNVIKAERIYIIVWNWDNVAWWNYLKGILYYGVQTEVYIFVDDIGWFAIGQWSSKQGLFVLRSNTANILQLHVQNILTIIRKQRFEMNGNTFYRRMQHISINLREMTKLKITFINALSTPMAELFVYTFNNSYCKMCIKLKLKIN